MNKQAEQLEDAICSAIEKLVEAGYGDGDHPIIDEVMHELQDAMEAVRFPSCSQ